MGIGGNVGENVGENVGSKGRIIVPPATAFTPIATAVFNGGSQDGICHDETWATTGGLLGTAPPGDGFDWVLNGAELRNTFDATGPAPVTNNFASKCTINIGSTSLGGGWNKDQSGDVLPFQAFEGQELWYRLYIYVPNTFLWEGTPGFVKLLRVTNDLARLDIAVVNGNTGLHMTFDEVQSLADEDFGGDKGTWRVGSTNNSLPEDQWVNLEWYIYSSRDPSKARMKLYMDGVLQIDMADIITLTSVTDKLRSAYFATYYNGGAPQTQHVWIDGFMWTTNNSPPTNTGSDGSPIIGDYLT